MLRNPVWHLQNFGRNVKRMKKEDKGEDECCGGCGNDRGKKRGDVADFLPEGKSGERNPQVQRGAAKPAPVPGRPSLP